jgi:DNA-binding sugar fermentation-stimulating protein
VAAQHLLALWRVIQSRRRYDSFSRWSFFSLDGKEKKNSVEKKNCSLSKNGKIRVFSSRGLNNGGAKLMTEIKR